MGIKGVFFDLYGTLLLFTDFRKAWSAWQEQFLAEIKQFSDGHSESELSESFDRFFDGPIEKFLSDSASPYEMRIIKFLAKFDIEIPNEQVRVIAENTVSRWNEFVEIDPSARDVLAKIKNRKKTALISNFDYPSFVRRLLAEENLIGFFDHITISGEVGIEKPNPIIFEPALEATGLANSNIVYIGDSQEDIDGALKAGIQPLLIDRDSKNDFPIGRIRDLKDILDYLSLS